MPTDLPEWTPKDPVDEAAYSLTFSHLLSAGDSINVATWEAVPAGLTLIETSWFTGIALIKLGGGVPGAFYRLTATVISTAGEILQRSATLLVRDM